MKATLVLPAILAAFALSACDNPADKTASATVAEAVATPTATAPATAGQRYAFTPESEIRFVGSKVTGSHQGGFRKFSGTFNVADGTLAGTGQKITIDMNSLWSDDEKLTTHLKSDDFFAVAKHPESTFELTGLKSSAEGSYEVSGNLTLVGTTKNITFPATATVTDGRAKIAAKFDLNRKDFGIVYPGRADDLIRDEVVVELKLEAVPQG